MKLRFRAEFFNAFNRPQWGTPDGTITSFDPNQLGTFGTISNAIADNRDFLVSILSHPAGRRGMQILPPVIHNAASECKTPRHAGSQV
jgi:hypothetical protein